MLASASQVLKLKMFVTPAWFTVIYLKGV
ncbi:rCG45900 [Rattus norvegicus]|uniref:RCG45900 n=1 Tax=Rattus norvegicus TaxID=10116 RepID=A6JTR9_RAT|nr:rCG45900 [Rattus norvegicus]